MKQLTAITITEANEMSLISSTSRISASMGFYAKKVRSEHRWAFTLGNIMSTNQSFSWQKQKFFIILVQKGEFLVTEGENMHNPHMIQSSVSIGTEQKKLKTWKRYVFFKIKVRKWLDKEGNNWFWL